MGSGLARLLLVLAAVGYPPIDSPATSPLLGPGAPATPR